jgi:hypothetical protein
MDYPGNRAIVVLLVAIFVLAALVYFFGYPLLISAAVLATFAALGFIVLLSAGDRGEKRSDPTA